MMISLTQGSSLPALSLSQPQGAAGPASAGAGASGDFASLLGRLAADTAGALQAGEAAALAGVQGSLPLQTVVGQVMAAERTLQATLAVRDKAVSAYLEISRMQI